MIIKQDIETINYNPLNKLDHLTNSLRGLVLFSDIILSTSKTLYIAPILQVVKELPS